MIKHVLTAEIYNGHECPIEQTLPETGKKYFFSTYQYTGPNMDRDRKEHLFWSDDPGLLEHGMGGNMDTNIKRFHGWRGTTCDTSRSADGVHICEKVSRKEFQRHVRYTIIFGDDLVKDRE
jgi:hypothetical protein